MVVLSRRSQVTFEHRRATFTPPYRHAIVHLALERRGGQFISRADRIFQRKPAIYGPGGPYISGDHIFRDRARPELPPHVKEGRNEAVGRPNQRSTPRRNPRSHPGARRSEERGRPSEPGLFCHRDFGPGDFGPAGPKSQKLPLGFWSGRPKSPGILVRLQIFWSG